MDLSALAMQRGKDAKTDELRVEWWGLVPSHGKNKRLSGLQAAAEGPSVLPTSAMMLRISAGTHHGLFPSS